MPEQQTLKLLLKKQEQKNKGKLGGGLFNPSTWKAEAVGKYQDSKSYIVRLCLKKHTKPKQSKTNKQRIRCS